MNNEIRVRFAPSPTGFLHIGGARTALYNYLFARRFHGKFILRIEDTDLTRSTDDYIAAILDGMRWLGLDWDEGPYRQTARQEIYEGYIEKLLSSGDVYRCYCSQEELEEKRKKALASGAPPRYDGRCRTLENPPSGSGKPTIRFRMPQDGVTEVSDYIRGKVTFENKNLDDFIMVRSDGSPTYNFVVVIDDIDMGITHIIRGDDHLNNTPKQMQIYKAIGAAIPNFAHLPMIMGADKTRLSKRHGAVSVQAYREMGYLPEALLNYLVRLGWSHGDKEIFSMEEMIESFSLDTVGKSSTVFNQDKLLWLNSEHIKTYDPLKLAVLVLPILKLHGIDTDKIEIEWLSRAITTLLERSRTLTELANSLRYYILDEIEFDPDAAKKFLNSEHLTFISAVFDGLKEIMDFNPSAIEELFVSLMKRLDTKLGKLAQPVRVAMTGGTVSPGIYDVLSIIGKERVLARLERAIATIKDSAK